ncbi:hypothetical protein [Candidatus Hamiltonella defensa]|uniref:hypothetical protein n=1 Tax=Candidatus Williamhamiltonella defendens TaxID=138072 RepID=UPI0012FD847C|nr:hypothetical protein [Candidatus Hamiltonella defensa]
MLCRKTNVYRLIVKRGRPSSRHDWLTDSAMIEMAVGDTTIRSTHIYQGIMRMKITGVVFLLCMLSGCAGQHNALSPISGPLEPVNNGLGVKDVH